MLTKEDLKQISQIVKEETGKNRKVIGELMAVVVTKDEFNARLEPIEKNVRQLKDDVNTLKDTQVGILNTLNIYTALNDFRVDNAHHCLDKLENSQLNIKRKLNLA